MSVTNKCEQTLHLTTHKTDMTCTRWLSEPKPNKQIDAILDHKLTITDRTPKALIHKPKTICLFVKGNYYFHVYLHNMTGVSHIAKKHLKQPKLFEYLQLAPNC